MIYADCHHFQSSLKNQARRMFFNYNKIVIVKKRDGYSLTPHLNKLKMQQVSNPDMTMLKS